MSNGLLGKAISSTNNWVTLYTAPSSAVIDFTTVNIHIVNKDVDIASVDLAITTNGSPSDVDFIGFKDELNAEGGAVEYNCFIVSPGEKIMMRSNNNLTIGRAHGLEKLK